MKPITFILLLTLASCGFQKPWKTIAERNYGLPGQAAPPDMVFIEGNDSMPSFYMGVMEEPNINYIVYLNWLEWVYGESYSEAVEDAIPKTRKDTMMTAYNDPYVTSYLTHPAFAYYPVTNLTWLQLENYLSWKTDRLNETILIRLGILMFYSFQKDDDNFVTEAHLTGQYNGSIESGVMSETLPYERPAMMEDGILFSGFRLPTEAEWEYASAARFQKKLPSKVFPQSQCFHPFGKDYYILQWGKYFESTVQDGMISVYDYDNNYDAFMVYGISANEFDLKLTDSLKVSKSYPSVCDYDSKSNGLINMSGGVKEWVIDKYSEDKNLSGNWLKTIQKAGFACLNYNDINGNLIKDSLGRSTYRFVGNDANGKFYKFSRYEQNYTAMKEELQRMKQWKVNEYVLLKSYDPKVSEKKLKELNEEYTQPLRDRYRRDYWSIENEIAWIKRGMKKVLMSSPEKLLAEIDELDRLIVEAEKKEQIPQPPQNRVVRGGTWKNPGLGRESMLENGFSEDVGFRCVLPYSGMPVRKGYKIKWGSDIGKTKNLFGYGRKWRRY